MSFLLKLKKFELGALACATNFSILLFNNGFKSSEALAAPNSNMFSPFGQGMVLVWGVAFMAAGVSDAGRAVWGAFALEKLSYVVGWGAWFQLYREPATAAVVSAWKSADYSRLLPAFFHVAYGPIDFTFMCLFAHKAVSSFENRPKRSKAK